MERSPVPHKSPKASLPCLAVLFVERNTSITMSLRSRASSPSMRNPASKEKISVSVELWHADVCFLHIQLMGTNVRLPKIHKTPPRLILDPQSRQQSLGLGINPVDNAEPCYPHDNIVGIHLCDAWNQSCQSSFACLSPFRDCSCKFVDRPQSVWSPNSCQVQACEDNLWAHLW